ncbi:MAG: MMPL family transporter [Actinobacteria bacterium]|nr:MMPL family transporter [Actinomycetota bacterium]
MAKLSFTARLARLSARHPWFVVTSWVALLILAGFAASTVGDVLGAREMDFLNSPESARGADLLEERLRGVTPDTETVIVRSESVTVDDPAFQAVVEGVAREVTALEGAVASTFSYYDALRYGVPQAQAMVSTDRHAALIQVALVAESAPVAHDRIERLRDALSGNDSAGYQVLTVGTASVEDDFVRTAESDLLKAEIFGLPMILLVLVVVFGAVAAAGVSMVLALAAIVVAIGLTALVGRVFELSFFVLNMVSMIGLAVGIDYALFIIERFREERRRGVDTREAITIAGGTASNAVLFSGATVVLALLGLFIVPLTTFRSLGVGAVLVVTVAVVAMLTLVPALLSLLGDRIDWPRAPRRGLAARESRWGAWLRGLGSRRRIEREKRHWAFRGFWGGIAHLVMRRPIISVAVTAAVLVAAAIPYVDLQTGSAGAETLPPGDVRTAYEILVEDFPGGLSAPIEVVVVGERDAGMERGIEQLTAAIVIEQGIAPGPSVEWNDAGDLALVTAFLTVASNSDEAYDAVARLRTELIPAAFEGIPAEVLVSGATARDADGIELIAFYTPVVFAFVLGLSFFLLMLVFRSIVVPLKAILMNLLSVGAAYGVLVLVFQKGVGKQLFGFHQTSTIEAWVPIFLFCILFGLSMDYHIFLLSRIREHFDKTKRNTESVAVGLQSTGRIITGAAAIMVVVFSTFASGQLVMLQQVGFGLAIAVLIDATVVRSVLVPASMALLGDANWYFPRWLQWLPRLTIEHQGEDELPVATVPVRVSADPVAPKGRRRGRRRSGGGFSS